MSDIFKELWFKWRAKVYQGKVKEQGIKRLAIKEKQIKDRAKAIVYVAKVKELNKL
jgi:hypothetical protein